MTMQSKNAGARLAGRLMCGASLGALGLLATVPAQAQQATDDLLETVTVTGTLIKGINPVGTNLLTFSAADIAATGGVTNNEVLATIPLVSSDFNIVSANNTGTAHQNRPKIRNLGGSGTSPTLILFNGHNAVGDGTLSTTPDATAIPSMVVERIDIMPDGGSALYGSDAVAGTINFITRKSYEGLMATTHIGTTGNYDQFQMGLMGGHSWSSGSALLAYEYMNHSLQFQADLPYGRQNLIPLGGTLDQRATTCALANVTAGSTAYALNSNTVGAAAGSLKAAATPGQNKCDNTQAGTAVPSEWQHTFFGSFNQHLATGVDFSLTANWSHLETTGQSAQLQSSAQAITSANPFFQSINGETKQTVSFSYSPTLGSILVARAKEEQYEVVPQFTFALGGDWDLKVTGNYGRNDDGSWAPSVNGVAVTNALAATSTTTALDPYNLALTSPAVVDQIALWGTQQRVVQQLEQAKAVGEGTLFSLPGGDLKLAAGTQYEYDSLVGVNITGPNGKQRPPADPGGIYAPAQVHRYVESFFGELYVPLVGAGNEVPFVHALNVDISARYDRYSDFGGTTNPKVGLTYEPIEGLKLRTNMGTAFDAPSLADTGGAIDTRVNLQTSSTVRVPLSISGISNAQDTIDQQRPSFLIAGGNPTLQPQTANTNSFGFDYQPDFVPGLELSLTKWHVSLYHSIAIAPYTNASLLYATPQYAPYYILRPTLAQLQTKTAGIALNGFASFDSYYQNGANSLPYALLDARRYNLGNQFDEGLDWNINYTMDTDFGSLNAGWSGTTYTTYKTQALFGSPKVDMLAANTSPYSFAGFVGATAGPLSGRVQMIYSAGYTVTGIVGQTEVSAFMPVNLFLNYDLSGVADVFSGATANLLVNNLFDTNPPFINSGSGVANGSTLGRYFQIGLEKKF